MMRAELNRWLRVPTLTGVTALACMIAAVAIPTLARASLNGEITGCEFTPYLPFVLASALLLRWWHASIVAISSVAIMGGLFQGSLLHPASCFIPAAWMFVVSSALMIGVSLVLKRVIAAIQDRGTDESAGGIVFSLDNGDVWASWYGQGSPVRLGSQRKVSEMMEDFLAQSEIAKRLTRK